ncbi:SCO0930 family lipoprotein [Amycolatopsis sp., V23-08]|uniref:SCO0930 family lipoprotein n=1 Tax=Amycolatopsis heterodermiae TaxID=3110235 RepID=A0ABU5RMM6_9PSEU|nr:SCO0930 family lipoprotein [Amycolatopsis sp., V23-08]MEA5367538.1 SCO0930 family lipoprotein [Amycolatopsis sp., V23-08]
MNRARPVAAALLAVAGLALVTACGTNPYATSGTTVQPAALGLQQQQPASTVPAGAGQVQLVTSTVEGLGTVLADTEGHTLYRYAKDTAKPPKAVCDGACAEMWPPLVSDTPALAAGVDAQLIGQVTRPDGQKQVTVGGWPVYRYAKDTGRGVALGQNVSADWAAIAPTGEKAGQGSASSATEPAKPTTIGTTEVGGLGPVLTDQAGNTLYLFTKDGKDSGTSTCDGACAKTWPPVVVDGRITVAESVDTALIGQIRRSDGTMQVTVGGWPVYSYSKDTAPGEANGHGAGNTWYAVEPSGCKVDPARRPDAQQAVATSSSGGY